MGDLNSLALASSRWKPGNASVPFPTSLGSASVTWVTLGTSLKWSKCRAEMLVLGVLSSGGVGHDLFSGILPMPSSAVLSGV